MDGNKRDDYKRVAVPTWVYENAVQVQNDLVRRGISSLPPELLEPQRCPRCHGEVEHVHIRYDAISCLGCGYQQQSIAAAGTGKLVAGIGLGVLLGLGIAALAAKVGEADQQTPARQVQSPKRARSLPAKRRR